MANFHNGDEQSLWPAKTGNEWVFAVEREIGDRTVRYEATMRVSESQSIPGGYESVVDITKKERADEEKLGSWVVQVTGGGIHVRRSANEFNAPRLPETVLKFPVVLGESIAQGGQDPAGAIPPKLQGKTSTLARGLEVVDTSSGRMEALAVESNSEYSVDGVGTTSVVSYWVPRVGPVRFVYEPHTTASTRTREVWKLKRQTITNP